MNVRARLVVVIQKLARVELDLDEEPLFPLDRELKVQEEEPKVARRRVLAAVLEPDEFERGAAGAEAARQ